MIKCGLRYEFLGILVVEIYDNYKNKIMKIIIKKASFLSRRS